MKIRISLLLTFQDRSEGSDGHRLQLCGSERRELLTQLGLQRLQEKGEVGPSGQETALLIRESIGKGLKARKSTAFMEREGWCENGGGLAAGSISGFQSHHPRRAH